MRTSKRKYVTRAAAAGVVALTLAGVGAASIGVAGAASAPAPKAATTPSTCLPGGHDDVWPVWTDGAPGRDPGVTVWHDRSGWHVRVTHDSLHDRVFSGEIRTTGRLTNVHAVRLEKNDSLTLAPGGHVLRFRFENYGGRDGFDFTTHCAPALQLGFLSNGHVVPASRISIGRTGRHPARDPFVIARRA